LQHGIFVFLVIDLLSFGEFLPSAQLVVAEVGGDPVDPCREIEAVVDAVNGAKDLEEGLLGQVFGQLPVAQQSALW